jgi:hypothetical protein
VTEAVEAPENFLVESILVVGYSNDPKQKEDRKQLSELVFKDKWGVNIS